MAGSGPGLPPLPGLGRRSPPLRRRTRKRWRAGAGHCGGPLVRTCTAPGRGAFLLSRAMLGRSGYRALPLGDFDRFQQSSFGFLGSQKGCLSPERGSVGPGAGEWPPRTADLGSTGWHPWFRTLPLGSQLVRSPPHPMRRDQEGTRCGEEPGSGDGILPLIRPSPGYSPRALSSKKPGLFPRFITAEVSSSHFA